MKDQVIDYKIHCKHQFGEYVQVVIKTTNLIKVTYAINALAAYPTGNEQGTWTYFNISTGKPISHKKATNLPIPEDIPDRIHALAAGESEDFIIFDNYVNSFVTSDDLIDDSFIDDDSVEVKIVDDDDSDNSKDGSSDDSSDDSSSDDESENSGVSDRRLSEEGVSKTDRQQGQFSLRGARDMRVNFPPPCASHRSGLYQSRRMNYTHNSRSRQEQQ